MPAGASRRVAGAGARLSGVPSLAYEQAIVEHASAIADALADAATNPVPTCPSWDVAKLALHVGLVQAWAAAQVVQAGADGIDPRSLPRAPEGPERVDWLRRTAADCAQALDGRAPDQPAGRWRDMPVDVAFWRRRIAHETVVHRVDADRASDRATSVDGDLAADGISEVADVFLPLAPLGEHGPTGALHLVRSDGAGRWAFTTGADIREDGGPATGDGGSPTATVTGPALSLLLMVWGRDRGEPLNTAGDAGVLASWTSVLRW